MLTIILIIAGYTDLQYRKILMFVILLLFIYAAVFSPVSIPTKISGLVLTALPLLILAVLTDKLKGGDFKFLAMLAFAMGIVRLAWLLLFTTGTAVIFSLIKKEKSVPLAFCTLLGWIMLNLFLHLN